MFDNEVSLEVHFHILNCLCDKAYRSLTEELVVERFTLTSQLYFETVWEEVEKYLNDIKKNFDLNLRYIYIFIFFTNKTKIGIGAENVFEIYLDGIYMILAGFPVFETYLILKLRFRHTLNLNFLNSTEEFSMRFR